jgi:hypothetical protein
MLCYAGVMLCKSGIWRYAARRCFVDSYAMLSMLCYAMLSLYYASYVRSCHAVLPANREPPLSLTNTTRSTLKVSWLDLESPAWFIVLSSAPATSGLHSCSNIIRHHNYHSRHHWRHHCHHKLAIGVAPRRSLLLLLLQLLLLLLLLLLRLLLLLLPTVESPLSPSVRWKKKYRKNGRAKILYIRDQR